MMYGAGAAAGSRRTVSMGEGGPSERRPLAIDDEGERAVLNVARMLLDEFPTHLQDLRTAVGARVDASALVEQTMPWLQRNVLHIADLMHSNCQDAIDRIVQIAIHLQDGAGSSVDGQSETSSVPSSKFSSTKPSDISRRILKQVERFCPTALFEKEPTRLVVKLPLSQNMNDEAMCITLVHLFPDSEWVEYRNETGQIYKRFIIQNSQLLPDKVRHFSLEFERARGELRNQRILALEAYLEEQKEDPFGPIRICTENDFRFNGRQPSTSSASSRGMCDDANGEEWFAKASNLASDPHAEVDALLIKFAFDLLNMLNIPVPESCVALLPFNFRAEMGSNPLAELELDPSRTHTYHLMCKMVKGSYPLKALGLDQMRALLSEDRSDQPFLTVEFNGEPYRLVGLGGVLGGSLGINDCDTIGFEGDNVVFCPRISPTGDKYLEIYKIDPTLDPGHDVDGENIQIDAKGTKVRIERFPRETQLEFLESIYQFTQLTVEQLEKCFSRRGVGVFMRPDTREIFLRADGPFSTPLPELHEIMGQLIRRRDQIADIYRRELEEYCLTRQERPTRAMLLQERREAQRRFFENEVARREDTVDRNIARLRELEGLLPFLQAEVENLEATRRGHEIAKAEGLAELAQRQQELEEIQRRAIEQVEMLDEMRRIQAIEETEQKLLRFRALRALTPPTGAASPTFSAMAPPSPPMDPRRDPVQMELDRFRMATERQVAGIHGTPSPTFERERSGRGGIAPIPDPGRPLLHPRLRLPGEISRLFNPTEVLRLARRALGIIK